MSKVVYLAYTFSKDNFKPSILGIFTSERACRKALSEGDCYHVAPLNVVFSTDITPISIYKVGNKFLTQYEAFKLKGVKL